MKNNRRSRPSKKKGQRKSDHPLPAKKSKADFVPREIDITGKTGARVKVQSSVQKQENRALKSFKKSSPPTKPNTGLRQVIDETEEGTFTVMVGGQQRPKGR